MTDRSVVPALRARATSLAAQMHEDFAPLWVTGAALVCALAARRGAKMLHLPTKQSDWFVYLSLGILFPLGMVVLTPLVPVGRVLGRAAYVARLLSLAAVLIAALFFVAHDRKNYLFLLAAVQLIAVYSYVKLNGQPIRPAFLLAGGCVVLLAWMGVVRLFWRDSETITGQYDKFIFGTNYSFLIFVASFVLVMHNFFAASTVRDDSPLPRRTNDFMLNIVALVVIGMASARTSPPLAGTQGFLNVGAYVGPAMVVRQGGWLLWDVLAQYGFLSTLSIAAFPVSNIWQAFYVVNALALFISACIVFFAFRALRSGPGNYAFALILSVGIALLLPGVTSVLLGPNTVPSSGAMRFLWCYVMVGMLIWAVRSDTGRGPCGYVLVVGSIAWVVACLWSIESVVYASALWIPAYVLFVVRRTATTGNDPLMRRQWVRGVAPWLLTPPALLVAALAGIAGYYQVRLGHLPDWRMFTEAIGVYSTREGATAPLFFRGAASGMFVVFCAVSTFAAFWLRGGLLRRTAPLVVGVWAGMWAVSLYFIGRPFPVTAMFSMPVFVLLIAVIIGLLRDTMPEIGWGYLLRMSLVPVLVVPLTMVFGSSTNMSSYLTAAQVGYTGHFETQLPPLEPDAVQLFAKATVRITDPVVDASSFVVLKVTNLMPAYTLKDASGDHLITQPTSWLPNVPLIPFFTTTPARNATFVMRFAERTQRSGWLLDRTDESVFAAVPRFREALAHDFVAGPTLAQGVYQLTWYTYVGPGAKT